MKKLLILSLIFTIGLASTSYAQFGIDTKFKKKYEKMGKQKANEQKDKAEDKGMEEADKHLDKGTEAAEPGLQKAEEYEEKGEEYTIIGLQKYAEFTEGYESDVANKDPEDYRRYGFESAIVEYNVEGSDAGTKTLYIGMGGYKYAEYGVVKKKKSKEKTAEILLGSDMISINFKKNTASKIHNPMAYLLANPNRDWEETGRNMLIKLGYEIIGQDKISGKDCDIWKQGRHKIWVWNGLTLKSEMGKNIETATSIKIDVDVPNEIFEVPEGFELEEFGTEDLFPEYSEEHFEEEDEMTEEEYNQLLDEIETMSYSEYKVKVLEEEPDADDEKIKQSYLILRQEAKRRHR